MRRSSREVIFVNASPASERMHLLKSMEEINKMSDDCEDVNYSSLITKYSQRPLSLENMTLADFAALYYNTNSFSKNSFSELVDSDGFPLEDHDDDDLQDCLENQPCDTNQKHKQRKKARVIRSVWFNKEIDEETISESYSCFLPAGEMNLIYLNIDLSNKDIRIAKIK